jgi:hypothetical protein
MDTEEVIRSLSRELTPVDPLAPAQVRAGRWALFAIVFVTAGTLLLEPRNDLLSRLRDPLFVLPNAVLLVVFLVCHRIAFELSVPGAERGTAARALAVWGVLTWGLVLAISHPTSIGAVPTGWRCISRTASLALLPSIAAFSMLRRAAPLKPGWTGFFALLAAAAIATSGMQMICAKDDPAHVLYWHFIPVLVCAAGGAQLGRWLLGRRLRP